MAEEHIELKRADGTPFQKFSELVAIDEMAKLLKLKKSWLYRKTFLSGEDRVPHFRLGKYLRFHPPTVFEWVEKTYNWK